MKLLLAVVLALLVTSCTDSNGGTSSTNQDACKPKPGKPCVTGSQGGSQ
jgi:hypothetical protein